MKQEAIVRFLDPEEEQTIRQGKTTNPDERVRQIVAAGKELIGSVEGVTILREEPTRPTVVISISEGARENLERALRQLVPPATLSEHAA